MTNILTLHLDAVSQAHFDRMREQHYPAALNQIAAHLTLFHTLPDSDDVSSVLEQAVSEQRVFSLRVTGLRSLGRGVAYTLASEELRGLHARLTAEFREHLSPQDRQPFQPHVVVQNKARPDAARALLGQLRESFKPFAVQAEGLDLWHYLGGPWELAEAFSFSQ